MVPTGAPRGRVPGQTHGLSSSPNIHVGAHLSAEPPAALWRGVGGGWLREGTLGAHPGGAQPHRSETLLTHPVGSRSSWHGLGRPSPGSRPLRQPPVVPLGARWPHASLLLPESARCRRARPLSQHHCWAPAGPTVVLQASSTPALQPSAGGRGPPSPVKAGSPPRRTADASKQTRHQETANPTLEGDPGSPTPADPPPGRTNLSSVFNPQENKPKKSIGQKHLVLRRQKDPAPQAPRAPARLGATGTAPSPETPARLRLWHRPLQPANPSGEIPPLRCFRRNRTCPQPQLLSPRLGSPQAGARERPSLHTGPKPGPGGVGGAQRGWASSSQGTDRQDPTVAPGPPLQPGRP